MKIDVEALKNASGEPFSVTFSIDKDELFVEENEVVREAPLQVTLDAEYRESQVVVRGVMHTKVKLMCSRCLKTFSYSYSEEFEDEVQVKHETEIDLFELVRELFLTAIPLKPLCSAECQGLCYTCGMDLNEKQCGCPVDETDYRMAVLKKLLE